MGERGGQKSRSEKEVSGNYSKEGHTILERAIGFLAPPPPPSPPIERNTTSEQVVGQ